MISFKANLILTVLTILALMIVMGPAILDAQEDKVPVASASVVYQDGTLTLSKNRLPKDGVSFSVFSSMNPVDECIGEIFDTFECQAPLDATLNIAGSHIVLKNPTLVGVDIFRKDLEP